MKKYGLFILLSFMACSIYSQEVNSVAVNDTVFARMGETMTVYPLLNDYDPDGDDMIIESVNSSTVNILNFSDSTITFKVPDYSINNKLKIFYKHPDSIYYPPCRASIFINRILTIDTLDCNQIKTPIYPQNLQFWDTYFDQSSTLLYKYPHDRETSTMFCQDLWIGGKDSNGDLHLAAERYRQNGTDFWSGPLTDDGLAMADSTNAGKWFRTWKVTKTDVFDHINNYSDPSYQMPEAIESWPAHGDIQQAEFLAPFVDVDLDNEYHPENGDYPLIKGDESIFFIYNDHLEHSGTGGLPLGVEIHCMAWAYKEDAENASLNNTIFMSYTFFNRSNISYYDTYIGVYTDFDIGAYYDDYVGCDVGNGNFYGYNGRPMDGTGEPSSYGENPPTQGICILGGPFIDDDAMDNPLGECNESVNGAGFGDGIVDNERFGLTGFVYFNSTGFTPLSDPIVAPEYYNYMQGLWRDGSPRVYGGNGHPAAGGDSLFPARFMWPDDSDPCHWGTGGLEPSWDSLWTDETTGNNPADRKGMGSIGPFTFEAQSIHHLDLALVTAPGDQEIPSKNLLQEYIAQIKQDYLKNPEEFGNQYLSISEETKITQQLRVYPNPVVDDIIRFELPNTEKATYFIYSASGQVIESGSLAAQETPAINIAHLQSGWYILEVKTDGQNLRAKLIL
ncbi:MAG: T9SS type A sorting domain-containing protein [Bacteroidales bacterium]|nr:T9SS type A sorting domain-containing protein [Bacteroidales bacterium]